MITSGQNSHHFSPLYSINNDTATLQPVNSSLRMRQKSVCECCGRIGYKADICIIRGPKFLPPSLIRKIIQYNAICGYKPTDTPRECNIQPPVAHFKSRTSPPNIIPIVSYIMGILKHHVVDNGGVEV